MTCSEVEDALKYLLNVSRFVRFMFFISHKHTVDVFPSVHLSTGLYKLDQSHFNNTHTRAHRLTVHSPVTSYASCNTLIRPSPSPCPRLSCFLCFSCFFYLFSGSFPLSHILSHPAFVYFLISSVITSISKSFHGLFILHKYIYLSLNIIFNYIVVYVLLLVQTQILYQCFKWCGIPGHRCFMGRLKLNPFQKLLNYTACDTRKPRRLGFKWCVTAQKQLSQLK